MKILIELPTWLGDSVMTSPAIDNIVEHLDKVEITLIGSYVSLEVIKNNPKVNKIFVLDKKTIHLYKTLKNLDEFDVFFSFRNSYRTKIFKFFVKSKFKYQFNKNKYTKGHQVEKYNNFINDSLNIDTKARKLNVYVEKKNNGVKHKLLGINPGASYGAAKRWYPKEFANVACALSNQYDIVLFGGPNEIEISLDIEKYLIEKNVDNYQNLVAKTTVKELISRISDLDLFITGDSGPMHLAAAFQIPTVAIFGPTNDYETSQWMNHNSIIVKKDLKCQPCMKRTCPLNHHNCMKSIIASDVLRAVKLLG
jgi:heptosyltransferase II